MLRILNYKVYDLEESVIASRNAMRLTPPEYSKEEFEYSLARAKKLASMKDGSGHRTFLKGIRVAFDLVYPNYISPELQRYHFFDIIQSNSKMHKLLQMNIKEACNKYVRPETISLLEGLIREYNEMLSYLDNEGVSDDHDALYHKWMEIVSNCPQGIELFMRCNTNYLQLRTIYVQRRHHKLKEDWGAFRKWIEELPYAKEFITLKD